MSYLNGLGLAADSKEAAMWFRKAADQGSARGQLNLGVIYLNGFGVEKSKAQAAYWLELAACKVTRMRVRSSIVSMKNKPATGQVRI